MPLTCTYPDYDEGFYYDPPKDFTTLQTHKRKRCSSCNTLIDKGAACLRFVCWRGPKTDIEERICGDEVLIAPKYMCEKCSDQFMNLSALGFCVDPTENMFELLDDYRVTYGRRGAITPRVTGRGAVPAFRVDPLVSEIFIKFGGINDTFRMDDEWRYGNQQ